jgi:hypothetical protein
MSFDPQDSADRGILTYVETVQVPDEALAALVEEACDAFQQDFRYAEAMAKQAQFLRSCRVRAA